MISQMVQEFSHWQTNRRKTQYTPYGGGKCRIWGIPWALPPKGRRHTRDTYKYHHAKFHADHCHCRQVICNQKNGQKANL